MKFFNGTVLLLASWFAGISGAAAAGPSNCIPYTIAIASTVEACGPGLVGSKFKTRTQECPSGKITDSTEYDTSGCTSASSSQGGNVLNKCLVTPDACAPSINASNCPTGWSWTLKGSGIAHCVMDDPVCGWGTSLKHDTLGNPSCEENTCPVGQVRQSDGISCACPSGYIMSGSTCVPATPSCAETTEYGMGSCQAGYEGERYSKRSVSCPAGPYGDPSFGAWETVDTCTPLSSGTTCTASSETEYQSCSSGSGSMWRTQTKSCPNGPNGSPLFTTGNWDTSQCSSNSGSTPAPYEPPCSVAYEETTTACGAGYTGTITTIKQLMCPRTMPPVVTTNEYCGCANGATDYPRCVMQPPPPPAQVWCDSEERIVVTKPACSRGASWEGVENQHWEICIKDNVMVSEKYLMTFKTGIQDCFSGHIDWE